MELSKEQTDAITRLNETGVVFEFPDFETVIKNLSIRHKNKVYDNTTKFI